jgi:CBS domain-containing protein
MATVRDVMTQDVFIVSPTTPLKDVVTLLISRRVSGLPVVDEGHVVGVISEADLLTKEFATAEGATAGPLAFASRRHRTDERRDAHVAGQAMTAPALTIGPEAALPEAARLMIERRVNRLPVVEGGRLVGIITRADIIKTYLRPDAELAEAIRTEVLLDALWLDPAAFSVTVVDGVVSIKGSVERRSTSTLLRDMVLRTSGVVGATFEIHWALDDRDIRPEPADYVSALSVH